MLNNENCEGIILDYRRFEKRPLILGKFQEKTIRYRKFIKGVFRGKQLTRGKFPCISYFVQVCRVKNGVGPPQALPKFNFFSGSYEK